MRSTPNVGRILGIRIRLHYTWFVAFILITAIVVTQFPEVYPLWQRIFLGIVASLFFFTGIGIRELILNSLAISRGMLVKSVTLYVFGGVSQVTKEATLPVLELLVAVAGLFCNLFIAGVFYGAHSVLINTGNVAINGVIQWLAFLYFLLALFHFIPGFPLDGGKLLRAFLWKMTGNYERATLTAGWIGQGVGLLFIIGGILLLITTRQWFNGAVLAFVGWVLQIPAVQSRRQALLHKALQNIVARDIVAREYLPIPSQLSLGQLVRECILVTGQRYFIVADGAELKGVVTIRSIKRVPKARWDSTRVTEIMTPTSDFETAQAQQSAASVLEQMNDLETDQIPVLEDGNAVGIVTRDSLIRLVRTRTELGI